MKINTLRSILLLHIFLLIGNCTYSQWQVLNAGITQDLYAIDAIWPNTVVTGGYGRVYKSLNSGTSWQSMNNFMDPQDSVIFRRTVFNSVWTDYTNTYAGGYDSLTGNGIVFNTIAGGNAWKLTINTSIGKILSIRSYASTVLVCGENGIFWRSSSGQSSWMTNAGYVGNADVHDAYFNSSTCYLVTENMIYTINASLWTMYNSYPNNFSIKRAYTASAEAFGIIDNGIVKILSGQPQVFQNSNYFGNITPTGISMDYISTTDGLLRRANQSWERVIETNGMALNDVDQYTQPQPFGYACGDNGLILKKVGVSEVTEPYIDFEAPISVCIGYTGYFTNVGSNYYTYRWFINGTQVSTGINYSQTFNTAGNYAVRLIGVTPSGFRDTVDKTISVIAIPSNQFSITTNDSLLCKKGDAEIVINNADPNNLYRLYRVGSPFLVSSVYGNGAGASVFTGMIYDSSRYVVSVTPATAECPRYNQDTVQIAVEKTKAAFSAGFVNSYINEPVTFYNTSKDAASFDWNFNTASPLMSNYSINNKNPFQNSFGDTGFVNIRLIATSMHGCKDTLLKNTTYNIQDIDIPIDCNMLHFYGVADTVFAGGGTYGERIDNVMSDENNAVWFSGLGEKVKFDGRLGSYIPYVDDSVGYITKYDKNKVLKWIVQCINRGYTGESVPIENMVMDTDKNIYFSFAYADQLDTLHLIDATGQTRIFPPQFGQPPIALVKIDSNGVFKWKIQASSIQNLAMDTLGNVYMVTNSRAVHNFLKIIGPNNTINMSSSWTGNNSLCNEYFLTKIDSSGYIEYLSSASMYT